VRILFNRYLSHSASHMRMVGSYYGANEEWRKACELVSPWNVQSPTSPTLHNRHLTLAAAVLRLQGYEVKIES